VSVDVVNSGLLELQSEHGRLEKLAETGQPGRQQARFRRPQPAAWRRPPHVDKRAHRAHGLAERPEREVDDAGGELADEGVLERLPRAAESKDGYALTLALELDELGCDEGLRDPRKPLQDKAEVPTATAPPR
jgi:hypothetical protein